MRILYFCPVISIFFFYLCFFPRLISAVGDWMSTILPHMVWPYSPNLECRAEMCCTRLDGNTGRKKIAILAPSYNFVGLYLRSEGIYRQSEKNFLNSNTSSTCHDNMVNFGPLTAEIGSGVWGTPTNFNGFCVLAALLHGI